MGRPSKPIISKELAARAALTVIDQVGVDGMSLQLVAKELGVKAPSLYYHFKNKAEMLAEVARIILIDASTNKPHVDSDWREAQIELAIATRRSILRHPSAAPLMLQFFPRHLMLKPYDHWSHKFDVPPELQLLVIEGIEKLTFGSALLGAMSLANGTQPMPEFEAEDYPHLDIAVQANPLDEEGMFVETLRRFLSSF